MRKLRAAVIGFVVALPAALALPAAVPVAAINPAPSCSGVPPLAGFSAYLAGTHGGSTVTLNSATQLGGPSYAAGGSVFFSDARGNTTVQHSFPGSGNTISVNAPDGYSGEVYVCINNDSQYYDAGFYTFNPVVSPFSASGPEGTIQTVNGNFFNHSLSVGVGTCGGVSYQWVNEGQIKVTVPGPADACSGSVHVTEVPQDNSPAVSASGGNFNITPTTPGLSCANPCYRGSTITVQGSGYGNTGSWTFGPAHGTTGDTGFTFAAPDVESGTLTISAPHGTVSSAALAVSPQITNVPSAREGDTVTVNGYGFGASGTLNVGGTSVTPSSWSMDQIQFVMPSGVAPQVALTRDDGQQASAQFGLIPVISSVSPASAAPGSYVEISGSGFGPNPTVTIGGAPAQVALPGDTGIAVTVPSGAKTGKLIVSSSYGQSVAWGQTFTVLGAASSTSGGGTTTSAGSSGGYSNYGNSNSGTLNVKPNYGFLPLPAPPPGVAFHITAPSSEVKPGTDVPLTVNLQLLGKPVAGSTISFQVASSPGSDTALSAPSAVTDASGVAHVTLHTSKKAGQTIVIARSGAFADQIRIVGLAPVAAAGGIPTTVFRNSTLDPHVLIPFIGALGLAIMLLLGAVLLQLRLNRRQPVPAAAPTADAEAVAEPPKPKAPRKPRAAKPAAPRRRARPQPPEVEQPAAIPLAAGAEDIAEVIPLRPADTDAAERITRTRARARAKRTE